jgi:aminopeptidase
VLPCRIYLDSEDPDGLKGINQEKIAKAEQKKWPIEKPYWDKMENRYQWCVAAVPGAAWAKKLFPNLSKKQAMEKLWEAILFTSRVTEDPLKSWEDHDKELADRCNYLNNLGIKELHYKGDNGTNLTVGMIPEGTFMGGREISLQNIGFNANIPSEECYTSPMRGKAEGIVYSTKPLSYNGELIENFSVRFENGKAVEVKAEKNQSLLEKMISKDEGAAYLGECALVPVNSPISESGLLFYNTLFDENAACHLALGMGFTNTIRGYENKTIEECREMGINDSMEHVDFMIGYEGLDIDAVTFDGKTVPIFRRGKWAFEV